MGKNLFGVDEQPEAAVSADARAVRVVVNANLWKPLDYAWPAALDAPRRGQRVRVPLGRGNRKTLGFVIDADVASEHARLKPVAELLDVEPQLDAALMDLGEWISRYYLTPLGMVLAAMVPTAVGQHASRNETVVYLAADMHDLPGGLGPRQKRVLDELFEARKQGVEPLTLEQLTHHSGAGRPSIRRLAERGLVRMEDRPVRLENLQDATAPDPFDLNDDQRAALAALEKKLGAGFSTTLLQGVTGSGKTEVYVRAIHQVIAAGRQAILMVPEIALATQTLQRLLSRLPRVAVLHSGLTNAQRAFYYEQIRDGHASVVVGPRSAVFAPTRKLGLIVVDEEHESSYKQDSAPRYHGRDVAVMRASLEKIPIVLGSATPSLETLHNVQQGRYERLRLPHRVRGLPMPRLTLVNLRREIEPGRVELIGATMARKIAAVLDRREQVILLLNRRGFASYVFCPSCGWTMGCDRCDRTMVFHQATRLAMCHYCQATSQLPERCPACDKKILLFGMGVQRVEGELERKFPLARIARMDSDTMTSPGQFQKVFDGFAAGEIDILLGTQMVAKGLDFPKVALVAVASADTSLAISDFRSSERTFQLIVQVAGRAGRSETPGEVIVQTLHEDEPAIQFALRHDVDGFAAFEMPLREQAKFPPYACLVRFVARHADREKAEAGAKELARRLVAMLPQGACRMYGPQPAQIIKIKDLFRFDILLLAEQRGLVQRYVAPNMEQLVRDIPAEIIADVDPTAML